MKHKTLTANEITGRGQVVITASSGALDRPHRSLFTLGESMKLVPLQGINDLRFGDSIAKAVAIFGDPDERRSHPDDRCRTILYLAKQNLTLGFDSEERLTFIAVLPGKEKVELWGEHPFEIAARASDPASAMRSWIEGRGRRAKGYQDCFAGSLRIAEEGVEFCFRSDAEGQLEGSQLNAEKLT
jgi:hypothetical protein